MRRILSFLFFSLLTVNLLAQVTKRPLTAADYDRWESVRAENLSRDGRWIAYQLDPQEGNGRLEVVDATRKTPTRTFARGYMAQFSPYSRFLVMRLKVPLADIRKAKLKKKKPDEMPKDSLLVLNLATGRTTRLPNVKSVTLAKDAGTWLAVLQEAATSRSLAGAAPIPAALRDTLQPAYPASATAAARRGTSKKPKGDDLVLLNMTDGTRRTVPWVTSIAMSDNGRTVFYSRDSARDSLTASQSGWWCIMARAIT